LVDALDEAKMALLDGLPEPPPDLGYVANAIAAATRDVLRM
jgi:hypothetical protein